MKPDVQTVVQIETTGKPMVQIEGKIASHEPIKFCPGVGNQVFFDYRSGSIQTEHVKLLAPTRLLPVTVTPAAKKQALYLRIPFPKKLVKVTARKLMLDKLDRAFKPYDPLLLNRF